jgi:hypothetical protein
MANRELAARVYEQITRDPASHDQKHWVTSQTLEIPEDFCGTTGCVAGWAALLSGRDVRFALLESFGYYDFVGVMLDGERDNISAIGRELLELTDDQAEWLFAAGRTTDEVYAALKDIMATGEFGVPDFGDDSGNDEGLCDCMDCQVGRGE